MTRSAAPFLQLSNDAVCATDWTVSLNGGKAEALGDQLEGWDYAASLIVSRGVRVAGETAAADLGMSEGFSIELVVEVGSGPNPFPRQILAVERFEVPVDQDVMVSITVPSQQLSQQIILRSWLVLAAAAAPTNPLAATEPGSRLWHDRHSTWLEGDTPQLPMDMVHFTEHFRNRPQRHAPWFVNWSPATANREFNSAIRLYVNADLPELAGKFRAGDEILLQAVMGDLVSQVCEGLLRAYPQDADFPEDVETTLIGHARRWLEAAFGSIADARSILEDRPGEFRAALLANVRMP